MLNIMHLNLNVFGILMIHLVANKLKGGMIVPKYGERRSLRETYLIKYHLYLGKMLLNMSCTIMLGSMEERPTPYYLLEH